MARMLIALLLAAASAVSGITVSAAVAMPAQSETASSAALGRPASAVADEERSTFWQSAGQTVGATVTTRFARPQRIDGTAIVGAGSHLRIADALLQFSDGSSLALHTTGAGDRAVTFPARLVRSVRLTVAAVPAGESSVGLSSWTFTMGRTGASRSPSTGPLGVSRRDSSSGSIRARVWTASTAGSGQWIRTWFAAARVVTAVRLISGMSLPDRIDGGTLQFSDGSSIGVGRLGPAGASPTTIAFTPRVVRWVRFVARTSSSAHVRLRSLSAYAPGAVPLVSPGGSSGYTATARSPSCDPTAAGPTPRLVLLCPSNGGAVAGASADLVVSGPVSAALTASAWVQSAGAVRQLAAGSIDTDGIGRLRVPLAGLQRGPTAILIRGPSGKSLTVQIVNRSGVTPATIADRPAKGMTLVYDDEFTSGLSVTRQGVSARYASGKPNWYGVDDFGAAIFGQPTGPDQSLATQDGTLRIAGRPLTASEHDSAGYGRRAVAGLISSAHQGGSGFSAQYGYFEARMLAPAGTGTWPAFWMLSAGSLNNAADSTAEVDATEQYGDDTLHAYQTAHSWVDHRDVLGRSTQHSVPGSDWALTWHTFGARVTPSGTVFYIDGVRTATEPAVVDANEPFFFLLNLAYKDGWQSGLAGTRGDSDLYVDWVRVWV